MRGERLCWCRSRVSFPARDDRGGRDEWPLSPALSPLVPRGGEGKRRRVGAQLVNQRVRIGRRPVWKAGGRRSPSRPRGGRDGWPSLRLSPRSFLAGREGKRRRVGSGTGARQDRFARSARCWLQAEGILDFSLAGKCGRIIGWRRAGGSVGGNGARIAKEWATQV